jgi:hypothetical protein
MPPALVDIIHGIWEGREPPPEGIINGIGAAYMCCTCIQGQVE